MLSKGTMLSRYVTFREWEWIATFESIATLSYFWGSLYGYICCS
jgi:hypothetical protein